MKPFLAKVLIWYNKVCFWISLYESCPDERNGNHEKRRGRDEFGTKARSASHINRRNLEIVESIVRTQSEPSSKVD